jgi:DNA-binding HxlR family transcriptional regulator
MNPSEPPRRFVELVSGRWTLAMLEQLGEGGRRHQYLHDALDGVSYKVLTETLRRAERDGLIARHLDPGRVETATLYERTDLGLSLNAPLVALAQWVDGHWPSVEAVRALEQFERAAAYCRTFFTVLAGRRGRHP